jgi:hypothetical protein
MHQDLWSSSIKAECLQTTHHIISIAQTPAMQYFPQQQQQQQQQYGGFQPQVSLVFSSTHADGPTPFTCFFQYQQCAACPAFNNMMPNPYQLPQQQYPAYGAMYPQSPAYNPFQQQQQPYYPPQQYYYPQQQWPQPGFGQNVQGYQQYWPQQQQRVYQEAVSTHRRRNQSEKHH